MPTLRDRLAAAVEPRYEIIREIAAGGMGVVFEARDPLLDRVVAIKLLPPEHATAVAVERFLRECRILAQLVHPHIVPILDASSDSGLLWFVMPYLGDDTLDARLRTAPLDARAAMRVATELIDALACAHDAGILHRDIKPSNVFLNGDHALLADFGVAALEQPAGQTLTGDGHLVGTLRYMAPELRQGSVATVHSDLYSLGATLYEASTGLRWDASRHGRRNTWRVVPPSLRRGVRGALAPEPARRWRSARAFGDALRSRRVSAPRVAAMAAAVVLVAALVRSIPAAGSPALASGTWAMAIDSFRGGAEGAELSRLVTLPLEWFPPARVRPWLSDRAASTDRRDGLFVGGTLSGGDADSQVVRIEVREASGALRHDITVRRNGQDLTGWGMAVADSLIHRLLPARAIEFRDALAVSHDMQAVRAYFDGAERFNRGDAAGAVRAYHAARSIDPGFFMATWGEAMALKWARRPFDAQLRELAGEPRVPSPFRELVEIQQDRDLASRLASYETLRVRFPEFALIRQLRANELFSRGPLTGHPLREAIDSQLAVAGDLPPVEQVDALLHTTWGAIRVGARSLADSQLRLRRALAPAGDDWNGFLRLARAGRFNRLVAVPMRTWVLWRADSATRVALREVVRFGVLFDDPADQAAIAHSLVESAPDASSRASGLAGEALAALLSGQVDRALERLDSASRVDAAPEWRMQRAEWPIMLSAAGMPIPHGRVVRAAAEAAQLTVMPALRFRASWLLAFDAGERGLPTRDSLAKALQGVARTPFEADMVALLGAFDAGRRRDPARALDASRRIATEWPDSLTFMRSPLVRSVTYLRRGEWHLAMGHRIPAEREWIWHENSDVRGWPAHQPQEGEIDAALSGIARVRLAESLLERGETARGCALLSRVQELWRAADRSFTEWLHRLVTASSRCH